MKEKDYNIITELIRGKNKFEVIDFAERKCGVIMAFKFEGITLLGEEVYKISYIPYVQR